jgi:hypothetical protein
MKNKNNSNDEYMTYSTADIGCAGALITREHELEEMDYSNPNRVQFIFKRSSNVEADANAYLENRLDIKARGFYDTLKALKARIRE